MSQFARQAIKGDIFGETGLQEEEFGLNGKSGSTQKYQNDNPEFKQTAQPLAMQRNPSIPASDPINAAISYLGAAAGNMSIGGM